MPKKGAKAMKIAITAPTGNIGRKLVKILLDLGGHELVLLTRSPHKLSKYQMPGATIAAGDLTDAEYIRHATEGVDSFFWLIPADSAAQDFRVYQNELTQNAAMAARANAIPHVVLVSSIGAQYDQGTGLIGGLHDTEKTFRDIVAGLTILRPAFFMENFIPMLQGTKKVHTLHLPVSGKTQIPMIATRDIAPVAAKALAHPTPEKPRVFELLGPRDYSFDEAAEIIGKAIHCKLKHIKVKDDETIASLLSAGFSDDAANMYIEMFHGIESGLVSPEMPRNLENTTRTTLAEFSKNVIFNILQPH